MIVSFRRDYEFLTYALRSIQKFATGFNKVVVVVPDVDDNLFKPLVEQFGIVLHSVHEPKGQEFNNHQQIICHAELYCDADFILHMDSDCLWSAPVTPDDYLFPGKTGGIPVKSRKPILLHRPYSTVTDANHAGWKTRAEKALKRPVLYDFMVRHPAVHWRRTYPGLRAHVERVHSLEEGGFKKWVLSQSSDFPQGFAEFPTLGAYAYRYMHNDYCWVDIDAGPEPPNKLIQGWSREGMDYVMLFKDGTTMPIRQRWEEILK
jgi:hypothetical protein